MNRTLTNFLNEYTELDLKRFYFLMADLEACDYFNKEGQIFFKRCYKDFINNENKNNSAL